jgi:signal peptidase I
MTARAAIVAALVTGCARTPAPAEAPGEAAAPAVVAPAHVLLAGHAPLFGNAPRGTRLLARIGGRELAEQLPTELAGALWAVARDCSVDLGGVSLIEVAVAEPASLRIDVLGDVDEKRIGCVLAVLGADPTVRPAAIDGGVRLATPDALADGPGAPAELRDAFGAPGTVLAAKLGETVVRLDLAALQQARAHEVESFVVPSRSMLPTLAVGDHVLVDRVPAPPRRGEVSTFRIPDSGGFVKRVIGLAGDRVEVIDGRPIVDGRLAPHCRIGSHDFVVEGSGVLHGEIYLEALAGRSYLTMYDAPPTPRACQADRECAASEGCRAGVCGVLEGPFVVGDGDVFVMGDARDHSLDSRRWSHGAAAGVPLASIDGRPLLVWLNYLGGEVTWRLSLLRLDERPALPFADVGLEQALDRCLRELAR